MTGLETMFISNALLTAMLFEPSTAALATTASAFTFVWGGVGFILWRAWTSQGQDVLPVRPAPAH